MGYPPPPVIPTSPEAERVNSDWPSHLRDDEPPSCCGGCLGVILGLAAVAILTAFLQSRIAQDEIPMRHRPVVRAEAED